MSDNQCQVTELLTEPLCTQQVAGCFELMVQSQVKWEKFLVPAPTSVAILGELVRLAAGIKDLQLNQHKKSRFDHPESFQKSLMQVCNQSVNSFQETRDNLNKIQMYCEDLTVHVRNVGKGSSLNKDLPKQLKSIQLCAAQCMGCAESVEKELSFLSELLSELLEVCAVSQSDNQDKLKEVQKVLEERKEKNELVEKEKRDLMEKWIRVSQRREKLGNECDDVKARAFIDQLCSEGLKQMIELLPKIVDFLSSVTSPVVLAVELGKALMFLMHLVSELNSKKSSASNSEVNSFLQKVREQASLKIEEIQTKLEESRNDYQECFQKMNELGEESETLLRGIKDNQSKEEDVSTTVELMANGLRALVSIKSNWSEMINFIQVIPRLTEDCLKTFERLGPVSEGVTQGSPGALVSSQVMDLQVSQGVSIMTLIGAMSETYVEIYDKYLVRQLENLSSLLGGQGSDREFKKLQDKCHQARAEILRRAAVNKEKFDKNIQQGSEAIGNLTDLLHPRM